MKHGIQFLHAFAQTLAANALYTPGHPATRRSLDHLWQSATALMTSDAHPVFLFLGTAPVYNGRPLHELSDWQHSGRLAAVGVQRIEFDPAMTQESLGTLVERLTARLATGKAPAEDGGPIPGIAFGVVAVQEQAEEEDAAPVQSFEGAIATELKLDINDELEALRFVLAEAGRGVVARAEVEAVVRILSGILDPRRVVQLPQSGDVDDYYLVHPMNTALLAMTVAASEGVHSSARHQIGVAAVLHDVGMSLLPRALRIKSGLTDAERAQVETHTVTGAKLLLDKGGVGCALAAVVAHEHHLRPDGTGYPARRFAPAPHWASRLIAVCAAFAALRSPRAYRAEWPLERVLRSIELGAGTVFDPEAAGLVAGVVKER